MQMGGAVAAVDTGYLKQQLVESNTARLEAIERGEQIVIGVNKYLESEPSPLADAADAILTVSEEAERGQIEKLKAWRAARDNAAVQGRARRDSSVPASGGGNIMPASIACAKAGVTTGEWGWTLREAFGEYRAPTGVGRAMRNDVSGLDDIRADVDRVSRKLGRRLTFLVGKPGLDGHSNGAEQIAVRARDAGMQVVYEGIRLTPEEIVDAARKEKAARDRPVGALGQPSAAGGRRGRPHEGSRPRRCRWWSAASSRRRTRPRWRRPASPRSIRRRISS